MASVTKWSKVAIAMQSALGGALAITGITQANPAVVTLASGAYTVGEYVLLSGVEGMSQVNNRVFRVAAPVGSTFALEGEDSTNYDAFTSGQAQLITYGLSMATATGLQGTGGNFSFIDTTTIHDSIKTQIPGIAEPATYTFENIWDPADAALAAMKAASDNQQQRCFLFTFANGKKLVFNGYVGCTMLPLGTAQDKVTTEVIVTMFGRPTIYAT